MVPQDAPPAPSHTQDQARFAEMYAKYAKRIFLYFARRLGDGKDLAEDMMQETFLRAFTHYQTFQNRGFSYLTYLLTIAHNILANHFRPKRTLPLEAAEDVPDAIDSRAMERQIDVKSLWLAVQDLSPAEREVLFLFYHEDLPVKMIAARSGKTENSVKLLLSRARKKLAKHPHVAALAASMKRD